MKCSSFVRKNREVTLAAYKEMMCGSSKSKPARPPATDQTLLNQLNSQEPWKRKKPSTSTHFSGNYLKQFQGHSLSPEKGKRKSSYPINDESCNYCGQANLDETATWFQCDMCNGCSHEQCIMEYRNTKNITIFYGKNVFPMSIA